MTASVTQTRRSSARRGIAPEPAFWVTATAFLVSTAFSTATTPLWNLYQQRDGFSTFLVTIAASVYAVGVAVSLFFAGHLSDTLGRKPMLVIGIALEGLTAISFIVWPSLAGILVARVVSGFGIGLITATATALVQDLQARARPDQSGVRGEVVSSAANIGGLGIGAVLSAVLSDALPSPLITPYVVFLVLLVAAVVAVLVLPETVVPAVPRPRYRPQTIGVPREARRTFFAAAFLAFAAFSVMGLFSALSPSFLAGTLDITSRTVGGIVVLVFFTSAAVFQVVFGRLRARRQVALAASFLVVGIAVVASAVIGGVSLALFLLGGVIAGAGAGVMTNATLGIAGRLVPAAHRSEVLAGIFLAGYLGLAVPVTALGAATLAISLTLALVAYAVVIIVITVVAAIILGRRLRIEQEEPRS